ncbi:hypothetical protein LCL99_19040 [Halomonas denitrificans]|uniref:hypothetical protein n=1 Tax=Halomonas TaxID=2745 RepID=UPI001A8C4280|nr:MULTISPECIES: hypothetical protein [Halomonas]MED5296308.1 hypothetical protein [Pseudomonadota bacterium]MBN8413997.1 hypothetical protein [Halomonas litopenaei]MBY5926800.1 hypothetical protein [Halomonas sp. DP4Y7-2]MBY5930249.1 hypothetical protein [Halomonas sp. DP8Y7-3]MBY5970246.1 hypothetical protein [Halomonas denitrificans]
MPSPKTFDPLRALAISSQALGFIMIFVLGSTLESPRPWQGLTLLLMLVVALAVAVARRYRNNRVQKQRDERRKRLLQDDDEALDEGFD